MESVSLLRRLGFGEYEARAYVALLQRSPLNGYELAKSSGVPRADVYSALKKLGERGAVLRLDTGAGVRYAPVPPGDLISGLESRLRETLDLTRKSLEQVKPRTDYEHVWAIDGYDSLSEQARGMIERAEHTLLIALRREESEALAGSISRAEERGVEITTLCVQACSAQCASCRGRVHRHQTVAESSIDWLIVVRDELEVLAGRIGAGGEAAGFRSRQDMLVELSAWHVRHSIALAAVIDDLGGRLGEMLQPDTREVLASLGPGSGAADWLTYMRGLAENSPEQGKRRAAK